jgi:hypothetical protein
VACVAIPARPVLAQQASEKPGAADQQPAASKDPATVKVEKLLEAQHRLNGPAGNPECYELGTNALSRLNQDDIDTAFRHLDLYDRFGCPSAHVQAAYRCLLLHPATPDRKPDDAKAAVLDGIVHACWINPAMPVTAASAPGSAEPATANSNPPPAAPGPNASH